MQSQGSSHIPVIDIVVGTLASTKVSIFVLRCAHNPDFNLDYKIWAKKGRNIEDSEKYCASLTKKCIRGKCTNPH